jgi:hypothetical protein
MENDPALEAHEHAEHAEHAAHEGNPFISKVSITVAVLAVMAALASSLETVEGGRAITLASDAVLEQDKATDAWNEYQADSLKRHMYEIAADGGGSHAEGYKKDIEDQRGDQDKAKAEALNAEKDRDLRLQDSNQHESRHHWLTAAAVLIEIGIALSTMAIVTKRAPFWFGAMGLGTVGMVLFALAYLS